jgi:hypothetical protein
MIKDVSMVARLNEKAVSFIGLPPKGFWFGFIPSTSPEKTSVSWLTLVYHIVDIAIKGILENRIMEGLLRGCGIIIFYKFFI